MFASFERLEDDLRQLKAYVRFLERATFLSRLAVPRGLKMAEHLAALSATRETLTQAVMSGLNYSSLIIALYGAVERFVEASISDYVEYMNGVCVRYSLLPTALREAHVDATLKLLQAPDLDRRGSTEEVIANLNSCLQDADSYRLTAATFAHHTANIRHGILNDLWSRVGVPELSTAIHSDNDYRAAVQSVDPGESELSFFRFDDIAVRRNEVAHGSHAAELLSFDLFVQYVEIVGALAGAVRKRVTSAGLDLLVSHHGAARGPPIKVFNNEIVCLGCESGRMCVGDLLVAKLPDGSYRASEILEMQVDGVSQSVVRGDQGLVTVGAKVGFYAKPNQQFWNVPDEGATGTLWRSAFLPDKPVEVE